MRAENRQPPRLAVVAAAHGNPGQVHRADIRIPAVPVPVFVFVVGVVKVGRRHRVGERVVAGELHPDEPDPVGADAAGLGAKRVTQRLCLFRPQLRGLPVEQLDAQPIRPPIRADLTDPGERFREGDPVTVRRRHPDRQTGVDHHRSPPPPVHDEQSQPAEDPAGQPGERPPMGQPPPHRDQEQAGGQQAQPDQAQPIPDHEHREQHADRHRMPHQKDDQVGEHPAGQADEQHPQRHIDLRMPGWYLGKRLRAVDSGHDRTHPPCMWRKRKGRQSAEGGGGGKELDSHPGTARENNQAQAATAVPSAGSSVLRSIRSRSQSIR